VTGRISNVGLEFDLQNRENAPVPGRYLRKTVLANEVKVGDEIAIPGKHARAAWRAKFSQPRKWQLSR